MGNNNECRGRLEHLKKKPLDRPVTPDEMNRMPGRENHAKRTRLGKIFSLGRGLYQSVLYPEPVHYQDRDTGEWREMRQHADPHDRRRGRNLPYQPLKRRAAGGVS